MQELRVAYRSMAWMAALGGYLLLHYRQWQMAAGYLAGAVLAALMLWSLQQLAGGLSTSVTRPGRWWWKHALWRYPVLLLVLWAVSRQPIMWIAGFVMGVTLLPLSVGMLAMRRAWRRPAWWSVEYWAPRTVRKSREL
ncbi:MAG: hypothetical protein KatS3mg023_3251 [Armatimonadota bacterium]|nr:MAG: hypothetical protein KatS3mg023_3251 [Armatimonadota bacterium]